jgi:hypothetical protein
MYDILSDDNLRLLLSEIRKLSRDGFPMFSTRRFPGIIIASLGCQVVLRVKVEQNEAENFKYS